MLRFLKKEATVVVQTVVESITNTLAAGEKVQLIGFRYIRSSRKKLLSAGRNPANQKNGEKKKCKSQLLKVPAFKAGKELKEAVK